MPGTRGFIGRWEVTELSDTSNERLHETEFPHFTVRPPDDGAVIGEYAFGRRKGTVSGIFERIGEKRHVFIFSFEGLDEGEEAHGAGLAWLDADRNLVGRFIYHLGRITRFSCRRENRRME